MAQAKKPKRCPNCGACQECGAPAPPQVIPMPYPMPQPYPVHPRPWPRYPGPYWQDTSVAPDAYRITYSNATNALQ